MQQITPETAASALSNASRQTSAAPDSAAKTSSTTPFRERPSASLADYVWLHMGGLYGHTWTSAYGDNPRSVAGAEWSRTLAGLNREQVDTGIDACRAEGAEWPPSAPRFRAMCLGIPTLARIRLELQRGAASPFARMVWGNLDAYRYRHADTREADRMLRDAYELAREERMQGAELPAEPVAALRQELEPKERKPADPAVVAARMAEIEELLNPPRAPELVAKDEKVMAEFGCSRAQAEAIVDAGTGESEHAA